MGFLANQTPAAIKRTLVGRAIHTEHTRQPIVPVQGTGYGAGYQPKVPAPAVRNPLQRLPANY